MDPKNVVVSAFTQPRASKSRPDCDYEDLSPDKKRQKRGKERREKKNEGERKKKEKYRGEAKARGGRRDSCASLKAARALILNPG